ncbi:hypothetical protein GUJ93_ZPchr0010g7949 [Zizania palustris]|uniref:Uncharacterized protein n=1 Tax=Zizania palustris TaxID=103762 RepID=A0A8J5TGS5_ZIZPA|nr:hypothetical protein GUJ93_ZPchr0010g7949 [Zizania palustris]
MWRASLVLALTLLDRSLYTHQRKVESVLLLALLLHGALQSGEGVWYRLQRPDNVFYRLESLNDIGEGNLLLHARPNTMADGRIRPDEVPGLFAEWAPWWRLSKRTWRSNGKSLHDISSPLDNQLVRELEGWVSSTKLVQFHPCGFSSWSVLPMDQHFLAASSQSALRDFQGLQAGSTMSNGRQCSRGLWRIPMIWLEKSNMEDIMNLGTTGNGAMQEAKPDPIISTECQLRVLAVILVFVVVLSLFQALADLEKEVILVTELLVYCRKMCSRIVWQ